MGSRTPEAPDGKGLGSAAKGQGLSGGPQPPKLMIRKADRQGGAPRFEVSLLENRKVLGEDVTQGWTIMGRKAGETLDAQSRRTTALRYPVSHGQIGRFQLVREDARYAQPLRPESGRQEVGMRAGVFVQTISYERPTIKRNINVQLCPCNHPVDARHSSCPRKCLCQNYGATRGD
jgi:hypothetical protein